MTDLEAPPAGNVFLYRHVCNAWCRPADRVHALAGHGDTSAQDTTLETIWGRVEVSTVILAELPPDGAGRPATFTIGRFLDQDPSYWSGETHRG